MQLIVTGHHLEVTEALKAHIDAKFEKLARHFDNVAAVSYTHLTLPTICSV